MTSTEDGRVVWKHIGLHNHSVGTFVADSNGIRWKSAATGNEDADVSTSRTVPSKALREAQWTVFGRSGHLRLLNHAAKNLKHELRFDGFPPTDLDKLRQTLQSLYQIDLQKHNMSSTGTSWGLTDIKNNNLAFQQCLLEDADEEGEEFEPREGDEVMTLDLTEVSQCVLPGNNRNEIELQFPESDTVEAGTDQLVSIRFYVPPDPDSDPHDRTEASSAELLQQKIMSTAKIKATTGDVIVSFSESQGSFLTPRGRYSIALYDYFFRMRGNKYDYKIKYDDISRLFLLPKPDEVHMAFVISLDKPIRQGQQRYQHLVLQLTKDPSEVTVNLTEETLQKEYNGDIQPLMTGALSNLVAKSFKVIAKKKVFIPGKFANANQQSCVKCALRASEGHLYPLEKQFIFIHKPTVLIRHDEVESVEFQRYAGGQGSTRNFDFCITLKASATVGSAQKEYIFSGIDRSDYTGLYNFLSTKKIRIKNLQADTFGDEPVERRGPVYNEDEIFGAGPPGEGEESEDEDYDVEDEEEEGSEGGSDDSDEHIDDDDLGSEVDDDMDSDLEEARAKAGGSSQPKAKAKKSKKRAKEDSDDDNETPKKTKKAKKDPHAPKRALSAYMFFSTENRAKIQEENPGANFGEMGKLVAEKFKALSAEEKTPYDDKAAADKKRYQNEMANYEPPAEFAKGANNGGGKKVGKKKKKKDPNEPKRPLTVYLLYSNSVRAQLKEENPDLSFGDLTKLIGQKYKALGDEERAELAEKAKVEKEKYKEAMEVYKKKKAEEAEDEEAEDEDVVSDDSDDDSEASDDSD